MGDFNIVDSDSPGFNALEDAGFQIVANNEGSNKDQTKFYDQISFMPRANEIRRALSKNGWVQAAWGLTFR
ncbi:MAG: hypothetical protein OXU63_07020, partial [Acidobacteriota bacterium]|nr:hypothetical protein [Acidobacteriota bacterium]